MVGDWCERNKKEGYIGYICICSIDITYKRVLRVYTIYTCNMDTSHLNAYTIHIFVLKSKEK